MLQSIVLGLHVVVCLLIVGLVLLQRGKGADAGTGFGAGASGTVFGARGSANFLSRTTAALATAFFVTSLALAFFANQPSSAPGSLLERMTPSQQESPNRTMPRATPPAEDLDEPPSLPADDAPAGELPDVGEPPSQAPESAEGND